MKLISSTEVLALGTNSDYGVDLVNTNHLHQVGCLGKGIKIAILDTGLDIEHDVFKNKNIQGYNFANGGTNDFIDRNGHGTHVAGVINKIAPESELLIVKVLNDDGSGTYDWFVSGIQYAIDQNVDIISMSLGGSANDSRLLHVIKLAVDRNILVVCAAGNNGDGYSETDEYIFPGSYNEVIQVGAINENYCVAGFSNSNNNVDIVAPGTSIESTFLNNTYKALSGTSMATPHVTGALALIKEWSRKEFEREFTESELYSQLIKSTKIINGVSRRQQGNGYLYLNQEFTK